MPVSRTAAVRAAWHSPAKRTDIDRGTTAVDRRVRGEDDPLPLHQQMAAVRGDQGHPGSKGSPVRAKRTERSVSRLSHRETGGKTGGNVLDDEDRAEVDGGIPSTGEGWPAGRG